MNHMKLQKDLTCQSASARPPVYSWKMENFKVVQNVRIQDSLFEPPLIVAPFYLLIFLKTFFLKTYYRWILKQDRNFLSENSIRNDNFVEVHFRLLLAI